MAISTIESTSRIVEKVIPYAGKLFRKYGYKKTTVDEISSGIHISKKTLYSVFPSKDAILRETVWRDITKIVHSFNDTVPPGSQPDTILLSLCRYIFTDRIKRGEKGYFGGLYVDDGDINKAWLEALKRVIKIIYVDGSKKGLFKQADSNIATDIIVSIIMLAVKNFHISTEPLKMFNDSLNMIADAVAFKDRIIFDSLV